MLILDLWTISFHAEVVFGLGKNLLFKSVLEHCEASIWVNVAFCMNLHLQSVKTVGIWWHLKWATKSNNTAPCHLNVAHLCHTKIQCKNKTDTLQINKKYGYNLNERIFIHFDAFLIYT